MKKKENDNRVLIIEGVNKMSEQMFNFFRDNSQYQQYYFGVIGYATELFMRFLCDQSGENYDRMSESYRRYLSAVHNDIKAIKQEDLMVNRNDRTRQNL